MTPENLTNEELRAEMQSWRMGPRYLCKACQQNPPKMLLNNGVVERNGIAMCADCAAYADKERAQVLHASVKKSERERSAKAKKNSKYFDAWGCGRPLLVARRGFSEAYRALNEARYEMSKGHGDGQSLTEAEEFWLNAVTGACLEMRDLCDQFKVAHAALPGFEDAALVHQADQALHNARCLYLDEHDREQAIAESHARIARNREIYETELAAGRIYGLQADESEGK